MAKIEPFAALRYAPDLRPSLSELLTPPYDVISRGLQQELYDRHGNNLVRIDLGKEEPGDDDRVNKYARASRLWEEWKAGGVIVRDPRPALYVYEQEFDLPRREHARRRGFFCAVALESLQGGGIRAHERTFPGPKADRLKLMRATQCNLSPIFCVYDDERRQADRLIDQAIESHAPEEVRIDGIVHRLWTVDGAEAIEGIVEAMRDLALYIADGHHRYETCLQYRDEEQKHRGESGGSAPSQSTLMVLANMHQEGMEILPTHRLLAMSPGKTLDSEASWSKLSEGFAITAIEVDADPNRAAGEILRALEQAGRTSSSFAMLLPGDRCRILTLRSDVDLDTLIPDPETIAQVKRLDVTILHHYILPATWFGDEEPGHDDITFVKDAAEAIEMIRSGGFAGGFLLNPTKMEQVREIAELGRRMPQKSTYFYPKLITGLVMRDLTVSAND